MEDLLGRLAYASAVEEPVALVAAHPDDETLSLGSRLGNMRHLRIIHLTDGAPRDLADARRAGFSDCPSYAAARQEELGRSLAVLGAGTVECINYGYPDQEAVWNAADIVERLVEDIADVKVVITHPYEHGHPDHDTAALAIALACRRLGAAGHSMVQHLEFASYHLREGRTVVGSFWADAGAPEAAIEVSGPDLATKARARDCFVTQRHVIAGFPIGVERLRRAPRYDFRVPAPPGEALFDRWRWQISSTLWRREAAKLVEDGRCALAANA